MHRVRRTVALLSLGHALLAAAPSVAAPPRPRVAILANNSGTETTDLLTPFAVLTDAGVADVSIVALAAGPVTLMPGLTILPDATVTEVASPPDVLIVPAMHDPAAPPLLDTVRAWAAGGALVVSICDGAWVLANAGLLDGRRATSHWYSIPQLRAAHPRTEWRQDVRWVRDGNIITSAGVSASEPLARHLAILLAHDAAPAPASDGPPHEGARFAIGAGDVATGAMNYLLPWRWEVAALELRDGVDELALGRSADLLQRTFAVRTVTVGPSTPIRGRRGLRLLPEVVGDPPGAADRTVSLGAADFDALLIDVEQRYGAATRSLVALQIEYPPAR